MFSDPHPARSTIAAVLSGPIAFGLTLCLVLAAATTVLLAGSSDQPVAPGDIRVSGSPLPGTPADLLTRGHCWSGAAPAGKVAHRAVVTYRDEVAPRYVSGDRFVQALVNAGVLPGVRDRELYAVHGFCP